MILLADGGSTSVEWCLIDKGTRVIQVFTKGANPFFRTREDIGEELARDLKPSVDRYKVDSVHFFGAGCAFPDKNEVIRAAIADNIKTEKIEVGSDLLAAARGLCGTEKGIACILGTGSNSCYYDGRRIVENVSPLGYIIGDEGSGAVLGRLFVNACLKNQLTIGVKERLFEQYELNQQRILDKVYKQPLANRFLATFTRFILENIEDESILKLVKAAFEDFFRKNVMQYDYRENLVHMTGSVAYYFQDILRDVARDLDIEIGKIEQSPMTGLITYYSKQAIQ